MDPILSVSLLLVALAGIVTSLAILWSKVIKPAYHFVRKATRVVDVVLDLPEWCESVDATLAECKEEVAALKSTVEKSQI